MIDFHLGKFQIPKQKLVGIVLIVITYGAVVQSIVTKIAVEHVGVGALAAVKGVYSPLAVQKVITGAALNHIVTTKSHHHAVCIAVATVVHDIATIRELQIIGGVVESNLLDTPGVQVKIGDGQIAAYTSMQAHSMWITIGRCFKTHISFSDSSCFQPHINGIDAFSTVSVIHKVVRDFIRISRFNDFIRIVAKTPDVDIVVIHLVEIIAIGMGICRCFLDNSALS